MTAEQSKVAVRRFFEEGWGKGALDVVAEVVAPDFVGRDSMGAPLGRSAVEIVTASREVFPDLSFTVDFLVAEGASVAARLLCSGTHRGALMGIPPTGKSATWTSSAVCRVVDGKIAEAWGIPDALGTLQQLGILGSLRELGFRPIEPSDIVAKNKAIVRRIIDEGWNKGNLDTVRELISLDYVAHQPGQKKMPESPVEHVRNARVAFPDLHFAIEELIGEDDKVVAHVTMSGTNNGSLMGFPPTGKKATWKAIYTCRIVDGKVVENWGSPDAFSALQQIGILPRSGAARS